MSVYRPRWTQGGPYDDRSGVALSPNQAQDAELVEDGTKSARDPDRWFFAAERLAHAFPQWPWAMLRLACAHLLLEDADGALQLFEEARRLVQAPDEAFDEWLAQFRVKVEEERDAEDRSWAEPEDDGVIVQPWHPPRDIAAFRQPSSSSSSEILDAWNALKEPLGSDTAAERYARLVAVQSSELEGVFTLAPESESLAAIVREGISAQAVGEVMQSPPSGVSGVVEILQDFNRCLTQFASSAPGMKSVSHEDVKGLHALFMRSSRIGYVEFPGEAPIPYLVTTGQYRRRIVTASMNMISGANGEEEQEEHEGEGEGSNEGTKSEDGNDDSDEDEDDDEEEPWRVVQFARHQEVEAHMGTFLEMLNAKLATGDFESHDPFALAAWIHSNLTSIHPFTDGNGRVIRMLASLPLLRVGLPYLNVRPEVKPAYLQALHKAAVDADLGPLAELFAGEMRESIGWLKSLST